MESRLMYKQFYLILMLTHIPNAESSVITDMDRLYTDIFKDYNRKTLPVLNVSDMVHVNMTGFIVNVNNFNEISGELSVTVSLAITWTEPRISWNPSDYGNATYVTVCPEDLWRPQLFLLQSSDSVTDIGNTSIQPRIYPYGMVMWIPSKVMRVSCSVDVAYFPFDTQICELTFLNWAVSSSSMLYVALSRSVSETYYNHNSQWELKPSTLKNCANIEHTPCLNMKIILKRRSEFFIIYIMIPLMFLGAMNTLVFLMPPSSGERTSVAVTTFLSFVVYMGIVNGVVPQSSRPIALIYYYIMFLLIYSNTIMFTCIMSLRIYDKKTEVPKRVQNTVWVLGMYFLRFRKQDIADVSSRNRQVLQSVTDDITGDDVYELRTTDSKSVKENNTNNYVKKAPHSCDDLNSKDNHVPEWQCTWASVGKTFDAVCCVSLYLIFITASAVMSIFWTKG